MLVFFYRQDNVANLFFHGRVSDSLSLVDPFGLRHVASKLGVSSSDPHLNANLTQFRPTTKEKKNNEQLPERELGGAAGARAAR